MKRILLLTAAMMMAGAGYTFAQDTVIVEVPQPAREYVIAHPSDPVVIEGDVAVGTVIPEDVDLVEIPDSPDYAYVYVDKQPIIVSKKGSQGRIFGAIIKGFRECAVPRMDCVFPAPNTQPTHFLSVAHLSSHLAHFNLLQCWQRKDGSHEMRLLKSEGHAGDGGEKMPFS